MEFGTGRHASDEVLELYSMGRLDERTSEEFEEHLLICATCQDNLASADAYRKSMKSAAQELRRPGIPSGVGRLFDIRKPVWGLAALALLTVAGIEWPVAHRSVAHPALILLEANRGVGNSLTSAAPAAKPFVLMLDLTGLPALPQYRLEIVDAAGRSVFGSTAAPADNKVRATIANGLPGGMYFVRVYGEQLLREYGLQARN